MWDKWIAKQIVVKHCGYRDLIVWDIATMDRTISQFTIYNDLSNKDQYGFDPVTENNESVIRLR